MVYVSFLRNLSFVLKFPLSRSILNCSLFFFILMISRMNILIHNGHAQNDRLIMRACRLAFRNRIGFEGADNPTMAALRCNE
jgi:hypothetical protein